MFYVPCFPPEARLARGGKTHERGFSMFELLIAIAILFVLIAGTLLFLSQFRARYDVDRAAAGTLALLRLARERTIAADNDAQWGVHVTSSQIMLFEGASYVTAEDTLTLPPHVTASATLTGGGSDAVFNRIDGTTATNGTITLTGQGTTSRVLTIYVSGETGLAQTLPAPTGTRVTDTRHVHFLLPFSLNTSTTMTLTFSNSPNPDTVEAIDVQSNISNGQFLWEDDVDVNGSNQHLRIVSHSIGVSDTNLAIRRDRMENDKALVIDVDGVVIATYTAGGVVSGGVGVTVTVQ